MCTDRVYAGTRGGEQKGSPQLCIYTTGIIQSLQSFFLYTNIDYNIQGAFPLLFFSPC
jgi:hypothetical protein